MKYFIAIITLLTCSNFVFADDLSDMLDKVTVKTVATGVLTNSYWAQYDNGKNSFTVLAITQKEKSAELESIGLLPDTKIIEDGTSFLPSQRIGRMYFFTFQGMNTWVVFERELVEGDIVKVKDGDITRLLQAGSVAGF